MTLIVLRATIKNQMFVWNERLTAAVIFKLSICKWAAGFVCTFHSVAPGLNLKHTTDTISILNWFILLWLLLAVFELISSENKLEKEKNRVI